MSQETALMAVVIYFCACALARMAGIALLDPSKHDAFALIEYGLLILVCVVGLSSS